MEKSLEFFCFDNCNKRLIAKSNLISFRLLAKTFNLRLRSLKTLLRRHCMNFLTPSFKEKEGELNSIEEEISKKRKALKD